jgi:hypothetical protein
MIDPVLVLKAFGSGMLTAAAPLYVLAVFAYMERNPDLTNRPERNLLR